jgi:quercetin dioxygenase-like cupin family protein
MAAMPHFDWNQITAEQMNPQVSRKVIHTDALTVARLQIAKGAVVPTHQHVNEQIAMVLKGSMMFTVDGKEVLVSAGQCLTLPPNVPHGVVAVEDCEVIDLFTPRRQDWIDGDDSYLRK